VYEDEMRKGGMETLATEIQATARKNADFRNEIIAEYLKKVSHSVT
jgi:hypothetical protein